MPNWRSFLKKWEHITQEDREIARFWLRDASAQDLHSAFKEFYLAGYAAGKGKRES